MRWKSAALTTFSFAFVTLFAGIVWAADDRKGEFWEYWNIGWKVINFLILIFLLIKIAKEPLKNLLADRFADIQTEVNGAEVVKQESESEYAQVELKMAELESNIDQLTQLIENQGNTQRERAIAEAEALAETIIADAKNRSIYELRKARQKLKEELIDMAFAKAEELIKQKITTKDRDTLVNEYINKIAAAA